VAKTKHYVHRDQELKISSNRVTVQTDQSLVDEVLSKVDEK